MASMPQSQGRAWAWDMGGIWGEGGVPTVDVENCPAAAATATAASAGILVFCFWYLLLHSPGPLPWWDFSLAA